MSEYMQDAMKLSCMNMAMLVNLVTFWFMYQLINAYPCAGMECSKTKAFTSTQKCFTSGICKWVVDGVACLFLHIFVVLLTIKIFVLTHVHRFIV